MSACITGRVIKIFVQVVLVLNFFKFLCVQYHLDVET